MNEKEQNVFNVFMLTIGICERVLDEHGSIDFQKSLIMLNRIAKGEISLQDEEDMNKYVDTIVHLGCTDAITNPDIVKDVIKTSNEFDRDMAKSILEFFMKQ